MITDNHFVVLICVLLSSNGINGQLDPKCDVIDSKVCKCYANTTPTQVRCEDATDENLTNVNLKTFGDGLSGKWGALYIHSKELTKIDGDTFKAATFEKIFIEKNDKLTSIDENSFGKSEVTKTLQIRENPTLVGTTIFGIAKKFEKILESIWFDGNKIATLPDDAFVGVVETNNIFQNLKVISIDSQKGVENGALKEIPAKFISNLPKLEQVSLSGNAIKAIGDGAFSLEKSTPASGHVSIFLDKNPDLNQAQITNKKIHIPTNNAISVGLVLEETGIKDFSGEFVALLSTIANNPKGSIFLRGTSIATCKCDDVKKIKAEDFKKNIHGIDGTITCEPNKKLSECTGP